MNKPLFRLLPLATLMPALFFIGLSTAQAQDSQSPIDINGQNTKFQQLSPLQFNLSSNTTLSVINNGSPDETKTAARANVLAGAGSLTVDGDTYQLAQFHFHTPAENLEKGNKYPMEMHMVFSDASNHTLVVGRWIQGIDGPNGPTTSLDPIFNDLPQNTTQTHVFNNFDLNTLLPSNLQSFRYDGSLTTPPFTEGVKWIELAQPLQMSSAEINNFSSLFPVNPLSPNGGDARGIQDLNGRVVLTDVPGFASAVPEPETYAMLLAGLGLIGFAARRRLVNQGLMGSIA